MRFKLIFIFLLTLPGLAQAKPGFGDDVTWEHIQAICREKWKNLPTDEWNGKPEPRGFKFSLTSRTVATQPRIAAQKIRDSINGIPEQDKKSHIDKNGATWVPLKHAYEFNPEHDGDSLYSEKSALDVIAYRGRLFDVDGHHRNIVSVFVGSPETPFNVKADWSYHEDGSEVSWDEFSQRMKDEKYTYVRKPRDKPKFLNPCELADDPNLYFARLLTLNVKYDEENEKIIKVEGADPFLFVKINRGRPMQEFEIADQMTDANLLYNPRWRRIVPATAMQRAGRLFKRAHWAEDDERVIVFDEPQSMTESELEKLIRRHRKAACEKKLFQAK